MRFATSYAVIKPTFDDIFRTVDAHCFAPRLSSAAPRVRCQILSLWLLRLVIIVRCSWMAITPRDIGGARDIVVVTVALCIVDRRHGVRVVLGQGQYRRHKP